jgi:hypothetical protein
LVRPTLDNATRLLSALKAFGFPALELTPEAVADRRRLIEMGVPPVQIHVMSTISGVEWSEVWDQHVDDPLGERTVPYIGRDTLIRNKRGAGRPKGLSDIDALQHGEDLSD